MLHNCMVECRNCGENYYFDINDEGNDKDEEIFAVCSNCDCDLVIEIYYDKDEKITYWEVG